MTTIPIKADLKLGDNYGKTIQYATVTGLLIGAILFLLQWVMATFLPSVPLLHTIFILLAYLLLTGGLHIDGLADTADGLFSARDKEKMLDIMHDSRSGTHGVVAISLLIICYFTLIRTLLPVKPEFLILMPVIGRFAIICGYTFGKYARESGMGLAFSQECQSPKPFIISLIVTFATSFLTLGIYGMICAMLTMCISLFIIWFSTRKIGGITGDVCGAMCEISQVALMIFMLILM